MAKDRSQVRGRDFISAPSVRSARSRYVKSPLVPPRRLGLIGWIKSLFDRHPRPFAGSAVADEIDERLMFSRRIFGDDPHTSALNRSTSVESIAGQLLAYGREACKRADVALDELDDNLRQEEHWLDDCRPESIVNSLRARLRDAELETIGAMRRCVQRLVTCRTAFEEFRARHGLNDDVGYGKRGGVGVVGQLGVLFLAEFLMNAVFQSGLLKDGLLGGFSFAAFTSMATIIVGAALGKGSQMCAVPLERGGWQGLILLAAGAVAALLIVSELSLIRMAGDAGDLGAIQTSVQELSSNPFAGLHALLELPALAYAILIGFLIAMVALKFRAFYGDYPGYRKHGLALEEASEELDQLVTLAQDEIQAIGEEHRAKLHNAPDFIVSCKVPIRTLTADHENAIDQFQHDAEEIGTASRLFDCFAREHGGDGDDFLEGRATEKTASYAERLAERHRTFLAKADELCGREDVGDASVEAARKAFGEALDEACSRLEQTKASLLEEARTAHYTNRVWGPPTLASAA